MKNKTVDDYIGIAKTDVIFYFVLAIIIFVGLLIFSLFIKFYYVVFVSLIMIFPIISRIVTYHNLKVIKEYLVEKELLNKIGKIDYWNEKYYFLTENYMIIKQNKMVYAFPYSEIKKIYKETNFKLGGGPSRSTSYQEYLHLVLNDYEFKILTYSTLLVSEDYKEIDKYLLEKNPNIEIVETKKVSNVNMSKREK